LSHKGERRRQNHFLNLTFQMDSYTGAACKKNFGSES
jgi:hypothetical protein